MAGHAHLIQAPLTTAMGRSSDLETHDTESQPSEMTNPESSDMVTNNVEGAPSTGSSTSRAPSIGSSTSRWHSFSLGALALLQAPLTPRRNTKNLTKESALVKAVRTAGREKEVDKMHVSGTQDEIQLQKSTSGKRKRKQEVTLLAGKKQRSHKTATASSASIPFCERPPILNFPGYDSAPLICRLGEGKYSRRVFVIRSPTMLDENIKLSDFAQTRISDIRRLLHSQPSDSLGPPKPQTENNPPLLASASSLLTSSTPRRPKTVYRKVNSCSFNSLNGFASTSARATQQFWSRFILWELAINRSSFFSELKSEFHNQVFNQVSLYSGRFITMRFFSLDLETLRFDE